MNQDDIIIRAASPEDGAALLAIYAPYVQHTAITFEYAVPSLEEFTGRIAATLTKYPYLVAEHQGRLAGYAYTGPFSGRAAYDWSAETSLYIRRDYRRQGIGRKLYEALEAVSKAQHIVNLNACITCPDTDDEYVTRNSVQFHAHMGYAMVGVFHSCGYKFSRWYHVAWMEKFLSDHPAVPEPVVPFPVLRPRLPCILSGQE